MPTNTCRHLIINTSKLLKAGIAGQETHFHCALIGVSKADTKIINEAFQKQTLISVAGYTCYYHDSKAVKCKDCPKFEEVNN